MNFDGQHVGAGLQVDGNRVLVPVAFGIASGKIHGEGVEGNVAVGHVAAEHLLSVQVHHGSIVSTQLEEARGRRGLAEAGVEGVPEIGGRVLVVRIAAVGDDGRLIAIAVAQFGIALGPSRVLVIRHAPGRAEVFARVVVVPTRSFLDPFHRGHLRPTDEFVTGFGLCRQLKCHVREIRSTPRAARDEKIVQAHPTRVQRRVAREELHGRVEPKLRSQIFQHERRPFTGKRAQVLDLFLPKFNRLDAVAVR